MDKIYCRSVSLLSACNTETALAELSSQLSIIVSVTPRECPGSQATASKAPLQQLFGIHVNYTYVKVTIPLTVQNREYIIP